MKLHIAQVCGDLNIISFCSTSLIVFAIPKKSRLQEAIAALPMSSTLSFSAGSMDLEDDSRQDSQQPSQGRDAEGFVTPILPASAQKLFDEQKEQMDEQKEQMHKLLQQLEQQGQHNKEREERMERQNAELTEQNKKLIDMLSKV